jgi:FAD binding domain-containing protein
MKNDNKEIDCQPIDSVHANPLIVEEVTGLYPTKVDAVFTPGTVEQLQILVKRTDNPISIGGGRFSMGGQIAAPETLHIDMRGLNRVLSLDVEKRFIRVQSGIRWRDIQHVIDQHELAIKIMQTYSDFTVGGSISVNCHGRYIGLGPLVLSIRNLLVMLHDGELVETSPDEKPELFYSIVGCYGAVGIIVEAELDLVENNRVERTRKKVSAADYLQYFRDHVRNNPDAVFHNADLYPPDYTRANAVTWSKTDHPTTTTDRLNPGRRLYLLEKYFLWAITETPFGKWRREYIIDPVLFRKPIVHWRNFEAGYHVNELKPLFRDQRTYVLQEYFVSVDNFLPFLQTMSEILNRHKVNVVNISVRHAYKDPGSLLAWARDETFAFVLYYKQRTRINARERVAVWTRELIDAVITHDGAYYLPYQPHATPEQFHQAYPNASKLFANKRQYDPDYRFRNCLWDKYYFPEDNMEDKSESSSEKTSEFRHVYGNTVWRDRFYLFL